MKQHDSFCKIKKNYLIFLKSTLKTEENSARLEVNQPHIFHVFTRCFSSTEANVSVMIMLGDDGVERRPLLEKVVKSFGWGDDF